jgi:hypothetical protein
MATASGPGQKVTIRILAEAAAAIDAARQYLNEQVPDLGGRFLRELSAALEAIEKRPLSFARLETLPNDQPYRRALMAAFRYAVIFEMMESEIVVVAVAHTSRGPNYWLGRRTSG